MRWLFQNTVQAMTWVERKLSKIPVVYQIWWLVSLPIGIALFLLFVSPLNKGGGRL